MSENAKTLSYVSFFFALPFLLLAPLSGSLSDRYQKRNIILVTRLVEVVCTSLGLYFFHIYSELGGYCVLILMACHTAIFSPAKLGILPEMLPLDYLSRANGIMTAATYTGSILGSCLAPLLVDITQNLPINGFVLSASFCVILSIVSTGIACVIRSSRVNNRQQKVTFVGFKDLWEIFKESRRTRYLTSSIFLIAFFLLVGSYVQVEIIPFVEFTLGYPKHYGGYLFPLVALGVGSGSYIAGRISGRDIQLGYAPLTALLIGFILMALFAFSSSIWTVVGLLLLLGFTGGFYQVPLHAYVQYVSPEHQRGRILAVNNFLDFFGVLISAGIIRILGSGLGLAPDESFFCMGIVVGIIGIWLLWSWREHLYRLLLSFVLRKQLGRVLSLRRSSSPHCYLVSTRSYQEVRRVLALLSKTVRSVVIIMDQKLQPDWTTRLIPHCVPTIFYAGAAAIERFHALLRHQPDLCMICVGSLDSTIAFSNLLRNEGIRVDRLALISKQDQPLYWLETNGHT